MLLIVLVFVICAISTILIQLSLKTFRILCISGCSSGYCLATYPALSHINSQVNEQANAGLKHTKDQLSYMTGENFMKHCSFYLWNANQRRKTFK